MFQGPSSKTSLPRYDRAVNDFRAQVLCACACVRVRARASVSAMCCSKLGLGGVRPRLDFHYELPTKYLPEGRARRERKRAIPKLAGLLSLWSVTGGNSIDVFHHTSLFEKLE